MLDRKQRMIHSGGMSMFDKGEKQIPVYVMTPWKLLATTLI